MVLEIISSSAFTSSCNSKVAKDTTGEDLLIPTLQVASECRIRSCGWTSGAQLEITWTSSSTLCQKPSAEHCNNLLQDIFARALYVHQPRTDWERAFMFSDKASLCVAAVVCMCSQFTLQLGKTHKCTQHRALGFMCLHTLMKLSLRWKIILNYVLRKQQIGNKG